jgi:molecular chaperone Hsp33
MDKIERYITEDGEIIASAIESSDLVFTAQKLHGASPVATAALGRLLTAASMMGAMLKQETATITLKIQGNGPLGTVLAVSDSHGNCRGYVQNPQIQVPNKANGKLDVSSAVGKEGLLYVMRDYGTGEPYIGQVPLASGEIAEDITAYYAYSEQTPTVCALGVLVDKETGEVLLAGGFLIQLLPGATEATAEVLERNLAALEPVTTLLAKGFTPGDICRRALDGFSAQLLDEFPVGYVCNCSRQRVLNAIGLLQPDEILTLADEGKSAEVKCEFCNRAYRIPYEELILLAQNRSKNCKECRCYNDV